MNDVALNDYIENILNDPGKINFDELKNLTERLKSDDIIILNDTGYSFYVNKDTSMYDTKKENLDNP